MSFEFECPNGHLLAAEENEQGDECACPVCGIAFIVPDAPPPPPRHDPVDEPLPKFEFAAPRVPETLSIPCPNGHVLETPRQQLETDAACPRCGVIYRIRERDSLEYRRQQQVAAELREKKIGRAWLNWAIGIALVVVFGIGLLILSASR